MYGIVNKAIEELIKARFGEDKWEAIKRRSSVDIDFFISSEPYDDKVTYDLVQAVCEEVNLTPAEVLHSFGEWWVLKTGTEKYGGLMQAGGNDLKAFLIHLPLFHNRIMLIYPKLTPPEFKVSNITESGIHLHYFSKRHGLQDFVNGLLSGLGKLYHTPITVELLQSRAQGHDHEVFKITW